MPIQAEVKIVPIQQLEPTAELKQKDPAPFSVEEDWVLEGCKPNERIDAEAVALGLVDTKVLVAQAKKKCSALTYISNSEVNIRTRQHAFFAAFLHAYNNHGDIVLSPDDVWLVITSQFSKYVNDNAEKMRSLFVDHAGKKKLLILTKNEREESQWDEFFRLVIRAIRKNTKDGIAEQLEAQFSTTGDVERVLSVATIMDTFKQYFEYTRMIPMCGIANVHFMGTHDDWTSLVDKTNALAKFDVDGKWKAYVDGLVPVLSELLKTYQGSPDVEFWNQVMHINTRRLGSGGHRVEYATGWILKFFFGLKTRPGGGVDLVDIKGDKIDVPVVIKNEITQLEKDVRLIGGFGGVLKRGHTYRPQQSMIVFHDGNSKPLDQNEFDNLMRACTKEAQASGSKTEYCEFD